MFRLFGRRKRFEGPDFSGVDSLDKAKALAARGELDKVWLIPPEFGGPEIPENTLYLPPGTGWLKESTDQDVVGPLVQSGTVTRYRGTPRYSGRSIVPISLEIHAFEPGNFTYELALWGEGLKSAPDEA